MQFLSPDSSFSGFQAGGGVVLKTTVRLSAYWLSASLPQSCSKVQFVICPVGLHLPEILGVDHVHRLQELIVTLAEKELGDVLGL